MCLHKRAECCIILAGGGNVAKGVYQDWIRGEGLERVRTLVAEGVPDKDIAKNVIGISRGTLYEWRQLYPDFADAFKKSRAVYYDTTNQEVINAIKNRAIGYTYTETTRERIKNKDTDEYELVVTKVVTKHVPSDPTSAFYWLQNRMPDEWKDRRNMGQEQGDSGDTGVALIPEANRGKDDE